MRRAGVVEPSGRLLVGMSMVLAVGVGGLIGCSPAESGTPPESEAPTESVSSRFALTAEELAAGSARFEVHEVSESVSFSPRDHRVTAEVTTPETEPERVVEALMRAAVSVHRKNGSPFAVMVRLWETWPPPEHSQEEFAGLETGEEIEAYYRIRDALRYEVYALDGCGWSDNPPHGAIRCSGPVWTFEREELPAWILRDSPDVLTNPRANGWSLRVWD